MAGVPKDILVVASPNGWIDNSKALVWLEISFGPGNAFGGEATNNDRSGRNWGGGDKEALL